MGYFLIAVCIGVIPGIIASNKGKSFILWWIYGALLFIVALPHSIILKNDESALEERQITEEEMKRCHFCHEIIKEKATVCKYCGRDLEKNNRSSLISDNIIEDRFNIKNKQWKCKKCGTENAFEKRQCRECGELNYENSISDKESDKENWIAVRIIELIKNGNNAGDAKIQAEAEYIVYKMDRNNDKIEEETFLIEKIDQSLSNEEISKKLTEQFEIENDELKKRIIAKKLVELGYEYYKRFF